MPLVQGYEEAPRASQRRRGPTSPENIMTDQSQAATDGANQSGHHSEIEEAEQSQRWTDHRCGTHRPDALCPRSPDSRCPSEWVAAEGTLIRMLCRHYGWRSVQPGLLQPPAHPDEPAALVRTETSRTSESITLGACGSRPAAEVVGRDGIRRVWVFVGEAWVTLSDEQQKEAQVLGLERVL
jgi:hypothetical protein